MRFLSFSFPKIVIYLVKFKFNYCLEDKISKKKLERCELFETKEKQEEIFANKLNKALENLNSEYDNIHQIITQENQKSVETLEVFKVSIKEHLDVKEEEDVKLHRDHNEELRTCNQHASDNCSQHKVHSSWQYIHHILNLVDGKCFKTA